MPVLYATITKIPAENSGRIITTGFMLESMSYLALIITRLNTTVLGAIMEALGPPRFRA